MEPLELLGPSATLRYVATSLDGAQVADVLYSTQYGYTPLAWQPVCPGGPNCPPPTCDPTSAPGKCLAYVAPDGDPLFVLSASRGELFVVATDVEAVDLATQARRTIDLGGESIGATLDAATYDVLSGRLYVIDEIELDDHGHRRDDRGRLHCRRPRHDDPRVRREARLLSIDPAGGATVVARWQRRGPATRFALGGAQDGALYLAASGEHGGHVLVSLRVVHHPAEHHHAAWDEVVTRGIGAGDGVVGSFATYSSRVAVTFVIERAGHAEVARYEATRPRFHGGECMGDVF